MNLIEMLGKLPPKKIAVIGDIMLDSYIYGSVNRISPEAPVPVLKVEKEFSALGGAANVALNIAKIVGRVTLFGYLGEDESGKKILSLLEKSNISHFILNKLPKTIKKTRIIGNQQQLVRIDEEENPEISTENELKLIESIKKENPDIIIVSDYAKGAITQNLLNQLKNLNKKIIIDPKPKNRLDYTGAYLITPNLKEGIELSNSANPDEIGKILREKYNCNILLTQGRDGMTLFEKNKSFKIPTEAKEVFDVTGAGDSVISVIGICLAYGLDLVESAILANKVAGYVVGKAGTYAISKKELEKIIRKENEKIKSLEELIELREDCRKKSKKFVWANGCFDLLHPGNLDYLRKAKKFGDCLVVGLNSDESVRKLKGSGRPLINEIERAEILSSLDCVDAVIIFPETNPSKYIKILEPDIFVKGGSKRLDGIKKEERESIEKYAGEVKAIPEEKNISTTKIIQAIRNSD